MKKISLLILLILLTSCNYQKPQKDKHPEIPTFSEQVYKNPEKYGFTLISEKNEDIEGFFIDNDRLILVSGVGKAGVSKDSIVISEYKNFTDVKKYYYKIETSKEEDSLNPNISLYQIDYLDGTIYSTYHKFSAPDYKPVLLDSIFLKKRDDTKFSSNYASVYNDENILEPFEEIPVGNKTNCGGGKLWVPIVCPIYLSYFKINSGTKTISFKEKDSYNGFKLFTIFGKKCLFNNSNFSGNSRLYLTGNL